MSKKARPGRWIGSHKFDVCRGPQDFGPDEPAYTAAVLRAGVHRGGSNYDEPGMAPLAGQKVSIAHCPFLFQIISNRQTILK